MFYNNVFNINLDIKDIKKTLKTGITLMQNDNLADVLKIRIFETLLGVSTEVEYDKISSATITFKQSNGIMMQKTLIFDVVNNNYYYEVEDEVLQTSGEVICNVQLLGTNLERKSTCYFIIYILKDNIDNGSVANTNEYPLLKQMVTQVEDLITRFNTRYNDSIPNDEIIQGSILQLVLKDDISAGNTLDIALKNDILTGNNLKTLLESGITNANTNYEGLQDNIILVNTLAETLTNDITSGNNIHTTLQSDISIGNSLKTSIESDINTGNTLYSNLENKISIGNTLKTALDNDITTGNTIHTNLQSDITTGNALDTTLKTDITNGNNVHSALQSDITSANTLKTAIESDISTGNDLNTSLISRISEGNTLKTDLESDIALATTKVADLQNVINSADFTTYASKSSVDTITVTLDGITTQSVVSAITNTYTLNVANNKIKKFKIETLDTNAKTITITNVPTECEITIKLKFTNNAVINYPSSVVWKDGVLPTYTVGKIHFIYLITDDGGVSYQGALTGAW